MTASSPIPDIKSTTPNNRHVLIIGGAGYIGSVLTAHLLAEGYRVKCLDLLLFNHQLTILPFLGHAHYSFQKGDLSNQTDLINALEGITDVVLLAGLVGDPITKKYPHAAAKFNDQGYEKILSELPNRGLNRVVFVSTCSNYGLIKGDQMATETFELNPLSLYSKSKVQVEKTLLDPLNTADYIPTVLRFATAFGLSPRMRFDLTISEFTRALAMGEELLVYDAHTWRPYCHVNDFSKLIMQVLEAVEDSVRGEVFNAGGDANNYTKQMIVDAVIDLIPDAKVRYQEHGGDPRNYRVDFTKVRSQLGFTPQFNVTDGIQELIQAMSTGLFHDISQPTSFYGNWELGTSIND